MNNLFIIENDLKKDSISDLQFYDSWLWKIGLLLIKVLHGIQCKTLINACYHMLAFFTLFTQMEPMTVNDFTCFSSMH